MRIFLKIAFLIALLLSITSCTGASPRLQHVKTSPSTSSPSQTSPATPLTVTPIIANRTNVGPVPTNCPANGQLSSQVISPAMGSAVGVSPVWAAGLSGTYPTALLQNDRYSPQKGWPWKLAWEVGPNYQQTVSIRAGYPNTSKLLLFQASPDDNLTTTLTLDPKHPGHPFSQLGPDWNEWGSYIFLPGAGCYYLEATWPQGHWLFYFAVGI